MSDLLSVSAGHRRAALEITDCAQRGQCCAFLGPRLSGTSEVLQHVLKGFADDPLTTCVYLDLRDVESSTRKAFFASLAQHLCTVATLVSIDERHLGLVIADVSDKGMAAALFMSLCRTLMRVSATQTRSPALALQRLNELIAANSRSEMFLTIFYRVLNLKTGQLTYASAGHPAPLLWRQETKDVAPADSLRTRGTVLGVLPQVVLEERRVTLEPNDVLSLFTDGVTEPIDGKGEEFGEERLAGILRACHTQSCSDIVARTHAAVWDFAGQRVQFDDYTLVTLKRTGTKSKGTRQR